MERSPFVLFFTFSFFFFYNVFNLDQNRQKKVGYFNKKRRHNAKVSSSYHLCVECFSQLSFDSEVYTKSATVADFVYTSVSNESCEKHSMHR